MPKNIVISLRNILNTYGLDLLDVYRFKDLDYIRVKDRLTNKVLVYKLKTQLKQVASIEELKGIVKEILKQKS
ncbi:MAG: hypothetical protein QXP02_04450 [Desulfurococcaceae archaeon]